MRAPLLAAVILAGCVAPVADPVAVAPQADLAAAGTDGGAPTLDLVGQADAPGGYALRVHEGRAYVATFTAEEGISVFDVSDPTAPAHLGGTPPGTLARSVDLLEVEGRILVALSTGTKLEVWDLTDPSDPSRLASFAFGSHNVATHPAGAIYNARNLWDGVGGAMEIVDARDPEDVRLHAVWAFPPSAADGTLVRNQGCHDLTVFVETARAYCAAYEQTLILDVTDPFAPVILTAIDNPLVTSHHTAFPILDHTVLVVGDEWADNLMWGCLSHPVGVLPQAPASALWFYDLTASPPKPLSYLTGPQVTPEPWVQQYGVNAMCTAHNGAEIGEGTGLVAYGWFRAGLALIDASDPRAPRMLQVQDIGGAFGDARYADGHVFAADDGIGLTVFRAS